MKTPEFNLCDEGGLRDASEFVNSKADDLAAQAGITIPAVSETGDDVYAGLENALSRLAAATVGNAASRSWKPDPAAAQAPAGTATATQPAATGTAPLSYTERARLAKEAAR